LGTQEHVASALRSPLVSTILQHALSIDDERLQQTAYWAQQKIASL
jgi:hypothetical protein